MLTFLYDVIIYNVVSTYRKEVQNIHDAISVKYVFHIFIYMYIYCNYLFHMTRWQSGYCDGMLVHWGLPAWVQIPPSSK